MAETTRELDRYLKSTPKSKALWEDAKNYLPGGDSRTPSSGRPIPSSWTTPRAVMWSIPTAWTGWISSAP